MNKIQEKGQVDKNLEHNPVADEESGIVQERRDAVTKLAYASPLLVGLLFSKSATANNSPPPPPPPPPVG